MEKMRLIPLNSNHIEKADLTGQHPLDRSKIEKTIQRLYQSTSC